MGGDGGLSPDRELPEALCEGIDLRLPRPGVRACRSLESEAWQNICKVQSMVFALGLRKAKRPTVNSSCEGKSNAEVPFSTSHLSSPCL